MENANTNITQNSNGKALKLKFRGLGEFYIWSLVSCTIMIPAYYDMLHFGEFREETFRDNISSIAVGILILLFPIIFRLTFGTFPIAGIFGKTRMYDRINYIRSVPSKTDGLENQNETEIDSFRKEDYLLQLALSSRKLAKTIFSRAGVFLLVGVLFAITGLIFFYLNTVTISDRYPDQNNMIISLAKHFGILFFIEFIAFFFLRQYKSAMDEFRYYESIQRSREETYAIVRLIEEKGESVDFYKLIEKCGFRSGIEKLDSGQTTDLLESKRLYKDEAEIFHKILDMIGKK